MPVPRNWPDGRVRATQRTAQGHGLLPVESPLEGTPGRRGGREIRDLHGGDAAVRRRPRPRLDVPVWLELRPPRSRGPCGAGPPTTTPRGAWDAPRRPHTQASEPWAWRRLIHATGADAARQLGGSAEPIAGLLDRGSARAVAGDAWERLGVRGRDASARTRGHREVGAWVTGPLEEGGVALGAGLADRQPPTVAACLRALPAPRRRTLERACPEREAGVVHASNAESP